LIVLIVGLALTGALAGLAAGLLGIGGGIVLIPMITIALDALGVPRSVSMHIAVATSLATIVLTSIASARAHARRDGVDMRIVRSWAPAIVAGSLAGGLLARWINGDVLRGLFALLALVIGVRLARRRGATVTPRDLTLRVQQFLAALIGLFSSWIGIGGGSFSVPLLRATGEPMHRAVGTAATLGFFIAVPATAGLIIGGLGQASLPDWSLGYLHLPSALCIIPMTLAFAPLGARLAHHLSQTVLQRVFAAFLILSSLRMFAQILQAATG
jgi:uncharacterized membrane protein YfcA